MRVTLDDDDTFKFDGKVRIVVRDVSCSIEDWEKLQAYVAAANEAFDALELYCDEKYPAHAYGTLFKDILQKVGDQ